MKTAENGKKKSCIIFDLQWVDMFLSEWLFQDISYLKNKKENRECKERHILAKTFSFYLTLYITIELSTMWFPKSFSLEQNISQKQKPQDKSMLYQYLLLLADLLHIVMHLILFPLGLIYYLDIKESMR